MSYMLLIKEAREHKTEWTAYAEAMCRKLSHAVRPIEESSVAWATEQSKFCKLAATVRMVGALVKCKASSLTDVSQVLRGYFVASRSLSSYGHVAPPDLDESVRSSVTVTSDDISPEF